MTSSPFTHEWTAATTTLELARWEWAARSVLARPKVLVRPLVDERLPLATLDRLLRDIRHHPALDFYFWSDRPADFLSGVLGGYHHQLIRFRYRRSQELKSPYLDWLVGWSTRRHWPANAWLGLRVDDEKHYWSQAGPLTDYARRSNYRRRDLSARVLPRCWIWWPNATEAGINLGFAPAYIGAGYHDMRTRRPAAVNAALARWEIFHWLVACGPQAEELVRQAAMDQVPAVVWEDAGKGNHQDAKAQG